MWRTRRTTSSVDPELQTCMAELLEDTARTLICVVAATCVGIQVILSILAPDQLAMNFALALPTSIFSSYLALRLVSGHFLISQGIWLSGYGVAHILLLMTTKQPEIVFLFSLLPFLAYVPLGWKGALYAELGIIGVMVPLASGLGHVPIPAGYIPSTLLGGCVGFLIAWAVCRSLSTAALWSLHSFEQARKSMEEAQRHRAQLARVAKDLDQAYDRLQRANAALIAAWRTADQAKHRSSEFAASLSHELRTPLNLIIGFCDMMLTAPQKYDGIEIPAPYRSDLAAVRHNGRHLLSLVNDVLDLARLDAQQLTLAPTSMDLRTVVNEAVNMVKDYVAAKGLALEVHIATDVPLLSADNLRIRQVLLNLLVNAARFTDDGSISVQARVSGNEVVIEVSDTGSGIPESALPHIFDEFGQASSEPTARFPSTGLGLPISKKLISSHGGRMEVFSTYQKGTTFRCTLPIAQDAASPGPAPVLQRTWSLAAPPATRRTIILVRDDPELDGILQRHLSGYRVVGTAEPSEGVALLGELSALAIVTQHDETLRDLPQDALHFRCPLPSSRQTASSLGAQGYLVKPITHERLWAAIDALSTPVTRVVIADDDLDMTRLIRRMLAPRIKSRNCLEAHSGREALQLLQSVDADLLLLDLMMPDGDGHEVLARMKEDRRLSTVPAIVLSAKDLTNTRLHAPISIQKAYGFDLSAVLRCLEADLMALMPGWH